MTSCLDLVLVGVVDGERWSVTTNGHVGVAKRDPDAVPSGRRFDEKKGPPDPSAVLQAAKDVAVGRRVPSAVLLAFVGAPCKECKDSRRQGCPVCDDGTVYRGCDHCSQPAHACKCDECDGDNWVNCICVRKTRPGLFLSPSAFDLRLVGIAVRAMPPVDVYEIAETPQKSSDGRPSACLVIRAGDQIGLVMELKVDDGRKVATLPEAA